jgi:hypothetical protein
LRGKGRRLSSLRPAWTIKILSLAGHWWLTSIILATQEAKIRRTEVRSKPRQGSSDPILKKLNTTRAGRMAQEALQV